MWPTRGWTGAGAATHDLQFEGLLVDLDRAEALCACVRVRGKSQGWEKSPFQPIHSLEPTGCTHEVDADGGYVRVREGVVRKAQEEAGLAHPRVPDQHELEEEVIIALRHAGWLAAGCGGVLCIFVVCRGDGRGQVR